MATKEIFSLKEANKAIKEGKRNFSKATIEGPLCFRGRTIKGDVDLTEATIERELCFRGSIIKGDLRLEGTKIKGRLDLSTTEGPFRIIVDRKMAQLVHFAAPTTPLVVNP